MEVQAVHGTGATTGACRLCRCVLTQSGMLQYKLHGLLGLEFASLKIDDKIK